MAPAPIIVTPVLDRPDRRNRILSVFDALSVSPVSPMGPPTVAASKSQLALNLQRDSPSSSGITLKKRQTSDSVAISLSRSQSRLFMRSAPQPPASSEPTPSRSISILKPFRSLRVLDDAKPSKNNCPPFQFPAQPVSTIPTSTPHAIIGYPLVHENNNTLLEASCNSPDDTTPIHSEHHVLLHTEVQTGTSMFRRKKDYLVLTSTHILRLKNQLKASEYFSTIPTPHNRSSSYGRYNSSLSIGCTQELQGLQDPSTDKDFCLLLRHVVAVHVSDDARSSSALDVTYFDHSTLNGATISLQFSTTAVRDSWLVGIRSAAGKACRDDQEPIPTSLIHSTVRVVETEDDYDVTNFSIYKVVIAPASTRSTNWVSDDLTRASSAVYFLVVGVHKVHVIPLSKVSRNGSVPFFANPTSHECYGVLSLTHADFGIDDDTLSLTFRMPMGRSKFLKITSLAAFDIAARLYRLESNLRRQWVNPVCHFTHNSGGTTLTTSPPPQGACCDLSSFERLLSAYCCSYNANPANIRYRVADLSEDGLGFELLSPMNPALPNYSLLELLAIFRSFRSCGLFTSISFAGINLDALRTLHDPYGVDHNCSPGDSVANQLEKSHPTNKASLLFHEIRAIITSNPLLRCLNFDSCVSAVLPPHRMTVSDRGCGIVEAIFPACASSMCRVDTIVLNNIILGSDDLDLILAALNAEMCQFKSLQFRNCGLSDDFLASFFQRIHTQRDSLRALDLSRNLAWVIPELFKPQFEIFNHLEDLDISHMAVTSNDDPLFSYDLLCSWKLRSLSMSGIRCNPATIRHLIEYLKSPQSFGLQELKMNRTGISGKDIGQIMIALSQSFPLGRVLHLEVGENHPEHDHRVLVDAIASNQTPTSLSIKGTEYNDENHYRDLLIACALNETIRVLDMAQLRLPADASQGTCQALEYLFSNNSTIENLNISGEDSRLDQVHFGMGINDALKGLFGNTSLRCLGIENQMLGHRGASTLADLIKQNQTLQELHCSHNSFSLSAFTDIVNSLRLNNTILFVSDMQESKEHALKLAEAQVKGVGEDADAQDSPTSSTSSTTFKLMRSSTRSVRSAVYKVAKGSVGRHPSLTSHGSNYSRISEQEIQIALQLIEESWTLQVDKLNSFLHRNRCLTRHVPTGMDTDANSQHGISIDNSNDNISMESEGSVAIPVGFPSGNDSLESPSSVSSNDDDLSMLKTPKQLVLEAPANSPISPYSIQCRRRHSRVSDEIGNDYSSMLDSLTPFKLPSLHLGHNSPLVGSPSTLF